MGIIEKLKNSVFQNNYSIKTFPYIIGLRTFQAGVLFLAAAPVIAFFLLLISSFLCLIYRRDNYFNDKYNYPFIIVSILMIINCINITYNTKNNYSVDVLTIWVGLSNWLPFFWCFWGFQPFLKSHKLRIQTAKILIVGSLPVLISGFCQYFLRIYGPYKFFNNLIIWYQRPLDSGNAVTGLFNNQNYAGAWLCIIFPLCIAFLIEKNKFKLKNLLVFLNSFSFIYMIFLTSSRGSILSIFTSFFLFTKSIKNKFFVFLSLISIPLVLNLIPLISLNLQSIIYNFLPFALIKKTSITTLSNENIFPRFEIWSKSFELIKSNLITGYGAGTFKNLYSISNGIYGDIQHSHNIFLEISINHGLPSSLIIISTMIFITINCWRKNANIELNKLENLDNKKKQFEQAWIISFMAFFLIHIFDITYFDGRISTLAWILLAGMRSIINEYIIFKKLS